MWKKIRYRFEWLALILAEKTVPLLSRKGCFWLAQTLGAYIGMIHWPGRRVAFSNLEAAFGDQFSQARRAVVVRASYQHFSRTMIDLFWAPRLTRENFGRWIEIAHLDEVMAGIGPGRSCIFATFHYGNFEWAAKAMGYSGFPLFILAQDFKNQSLDPLFARLREYGGHEVAGREGAIIKMYKALRRNRHVAILTDLTLRPEQPSVVIDCFQLKTCVTYAHVWLHRRTGAPIVPLHCEPLPDGRWRLEVQSPLEIPAAATDAQIAQACWDRFEPLVRRNPAPWLWMYKHWRYRPSVAGRPYPFYAQQSLSFDALASHDSTNSTVVPTE